MERSATEHVGRVVEAVWRMECANIVAAMSRYVQSFDIAEDMAHEALVAALEQWPRTGVPDNPAAWLMTVAKHRAIDFIRRQQVRYRKYAELERELHTGHARGEPDVEFSLEHNVEDDLLCLMFMCCHPLLAAEARVALTLRTLGGLTTDEIARAFLVSRSTAAQRIVRAKRTLKEAGARFEMPERAELAARIESVLDVIYLIFNEGYSATHGTDWVRPSLCDEALRLGRIVAELMPADPDVHGLVALMELHASRLRTRVGPQGEPILLADQDRARWDWLLIRRGLAALQRAASFGTPLGPYGLQAAIAACHARARTAEATDWLCIAALYDELAQITVSPVVELNRAVAMAMAHGPEEGLNIVGPLLQNPHLARYHLLPAVHGDLLARLGRFDEARPEFERAAAMTHNAHERQLLLQRAHNASAGIPPPPWPGQND